MIFIDFIFILSFKSFDYCFLKLFKRYALCDGDVKGSLVVEQDEPLVKSLFIEIRLISNVEDNCSFIDYIAHYLCLKSDS